MKTGILKYRRIRDIREDRDIPQKAVAQYLNITQNAYSRYETSSRSIPIDALVKLADFYDTSVDYLLGRTDEKKPYPKAKNS